MDAEELAHECEHQRQWDAAFVDLDAETLETAADIVDADAMTCVEGTPQYERLSEVADQLRAAARALEADLAAG